MRTLEAGPRCLSGFTFSWIERKTKAALLNCERPCGREASCPSQEPLNPAWSRLTCTADLQA